MLTSQQVAEDDAGDALVALLIRLLRAPCHVPRVVRRRDAEEQRRLQLAPQQDYPRRYEVLGIDVLDHDGEARLQQRQHAEENVDDDEGVDPQNLTADG